MNVFLKILPYIISIGGILITIGVYKAKIGGLTDMCKDLPDWRSNIDVRVSILEKNDENQAEILSRINENLIKISTTVSLLIEDKLKINK